MSSPITISLEEEEQTFERAEYVASARPQQVAAAPRARDWKDCLLELLKTAPPEELIRLINKEGLKEVLKEIAQSDPLLRLFFLLYG
jgi:L-rhamnose mutarotase